VIVTGSIFALFVDAEPLVPAFSPAWGCRSRVSATSVAALVCSSNMKSKENVSLRFLMEQLSHVGAADASALASTDSIAATDTKTLRI